MGLLDNKDRLGALLLLVFAVVYLRFAWVLPLDPTATDESFTARTLPVGLALTSIVFSLIQLFAKNAAGADPRISSAVRGFRWQPMLLLLASMAIYSLAFDFLGFIAASFLFLLSGFLILGERRLLLASLVSAGMVVFLWLMLTQAFGLYLDNGDLYRLVAGEA